HGWRRHRSRPALNRVPVQLLATTERSIPSSKVVSDRPWTPRWSRCLGTNLYRAVRYRGCHSVQQVLFCTYQVLFCSNWIWAVLACDGSEGLDNVAQNQRDAASTGSY